MFKFKILYVLNGLSLLLLLKKKSIITILSLIVNAIFIIKCTHNLNYNQTATQQPQKKKKCCKLCYISILFKKCCMRNVHQHYNNLSPVSQRAKFVVTQLYVQSLWLFDEKYSQYVVKKLFDTMII